MAMLGDSLLFAHQIAAGSTDLRTIIVFLPTTEMGQMSLIADLVAHTIFSFESTWIGEDIGRELSLRVIELWRWDDWLCFFH